MAKLTTDEIKIMGRIYSLVSFRASQAGDDTLAQDVKFRTAGAYPFKGMVIALQHGHKIGCLTSDDEDYISKMLVGVDNAPQNDDEGHIGIEDQGTWQLAYYHERARLYDASDKLVSVEAYSRAHDLDVNTVRARCQRGGYRTAVKVGRTWRINPDDVYVDQRKPE